MASHIWVAYLYEKDTLDLIDAIVIKAEHRSEACLAAAVDFRERRGAEILKGAQIYIARRDLLEKKIDSLKRASE